MILLLSDNISLNPVPVHEGILQRLNKWNAFKTRGLHSIQLNINSLLPKIKELRVHTKSTIAGVIGICESKRDASVLEQEISTKNYKIICCDRKRHGRSIAYYINNDFSCNILFVFPCGIENILC